MKRILIIASHEKMADGMKDTLNFISGGIQETIALSAYVDNRPVEEAVDEVMDGFEGEDEVVVLTDLMVGSVNQKFFKYRTRPHTYRKRYESASCISNCYGTAREVYYGRENERNN